MLRLGFFTDTHARGDTPSGRIDDFRVALLLKLEWLGEFWRANKVDHILFGGDLFHTPDPSNSVINEVLNVLKSWGIPITGVVGSHDYFGYQMRSLKRTALGILHSAEVIELTGGYGLPDYVTISNESQGGTESHERVTVVGTPHTYDLVTSASNLSVPYYDPQAKLQIQIIHGDLLDKAVPWEHVLTSEVSTASQLALSGHYHPGWRDPIVHGNTTFVNPGAVCRLENTNTLRTPRVNIIDVFEDKFSITYHNIAVAAEHPFSTKGTPAQNDVVQDLTRLFNLIGSTSVDPVDVKSLIPDMATELGYSEEVVSVAFDLIDRSTVGDKRAKE